MDPEKVQPLEAMFCKLHSALKPKNHVALEFLKKTVFKEAKWILSDFCNVVLNFTFLFEKNDSVFRFYIFTRNKKRD